MKRPRRILVLSRAAVAAGLFMYWQWPGIDVTNAGRIRAGMTDTEVERLMGCPAGDYRRGALFKVEHAPSWRDDGHILYRRSWLTDRVFVHVGFDDDGHVRGVIAAHVTEHQRDEVSLYLRIRHWLGL